MESGKEDVIMAGKLKSEDLALNIIVNGNKAQSEIGQLGRSMQDTKAKVKDLEAEQRRLEKQGQKNSQRYKDLTKQIQQHNSILDYSRKRLDQLNQSLSLEDKTIKQLNDTLRQLKRLRDQTVPGTDQYNAYNDQIAEVSARLSYLRGEADRTGNALTRMGGGLKRFFSSTLGGIASVTALAMGVARARDEYARFDDKIADVMKTTNASKESVRELNEELEKIDTRTSQDDLLGLGRIGGKLGITDMDELRGFVEATNQVVVALNEDLGGDVESTVSAVGKLVDIFGVKEMFGMEQGLLKVGSAINELGMASTANEGYMVEFSRRMAGVAPLANISVQEILGLGATLDQLGQTSEVSSTALSKLFLKIASEAESFAKYAGMEVTAFKDLLEKDFMAAFTAVLNGVRDNANGINELASTLGDLGLDGGRVIGVLGSLANNTHILTDQINLANDAFEKGTSLTEEYTIKNTTAQAQLEKKRKEVTRLWRELGERLWPAISAGNSLLIILARTLSTIIGFIADNIRVITVLTVAITAYTVAINAARIATLAFVVVQRAVTAAVWLFNAALTANPIALFVTLLAAAGTALHVFNRRVDESIDLQKRIKKATDDATASTIAQRSEIERNQKVLQDSTKTQEEKLRAIQNLRDIMPSVLKNYSDEEVLAGKATQAIANHTKAILLRAQARAYESEIESAEREKIQLEGMLSSDGKTSGFDNLPYFERAQYAARAAIKGMSAYALWLDEIESKHKAASARQEEFIGLTDTIYKQLDQLEGRSGTAEINEFTPGAVIPTGDSKAEAKARAAAAKARSNELEEAKKYYQAQLEAEGIFRKDRRLMTTEELEKLLKIEEDYQAKVDEINRKYQHSATNTAKVAEAELMRRELAEKKYRDRLRDPRDEQYIQEQEQHQRRLEQAGLFGKAREQLTQEQLEALERLEAIHAANIGKIDAKSMEKAVEERQAAYQDELTDLRIKNKEELAQIRTFAQARAALEGTMSDEAIRQVKTLADARRILNIQARQKEEELTRKHLEELRGLIESTLASGEWEGIDLADSVLSEDERETLEKRLRAIREELSKLLNPDQADLAEDKSRKTDVLGMTASDWDTLFANLEQGKISIEDLGNVLSAATQVWGKYNAFLAAGEKRRLQEYEEQNNRQKEILDKRLKAGTISQEQYNAQIEKLDKEMAKKRARMEHDQAKRERNTALMSAIVSTAAGVARAFKDFAFPYSAIIAGIVGGLGALQIGTIARAPLPSLSGREDGGFLVRRSQDGKIFNATHDPDRRGYVGKPTVIVGENGSEFVANADAVANPSVRPILDVIDTAQRNGTISTLQLENILPRARDLRASIPGRQAGGSISDNANSAHHQPILDENGELKQLVRKNTEVIQGLKDEIRKGIKAEVALLGKDGFYEKDQEYRNIQNGAIL